MGSMTFPLILLGILLVFGVVFLIIIKRQEKKTSINQNKKGSNSSGKSDKKDNVQQVKKEDVFKFMEFDKILNNMIVQNNGTKFTMAIKCKGINYDLMSDIEQIAVEEGFITFLNTLRYPIQLYVQAQNIDLKGAIGTYKKNITNIKNELDRVNDEYSKVLDEFDATEDEINRAESERTKVLNVYEYASDIINYVERLSLNKNLLQRNFYVLVSYHSSEIVSIDNFNKEEIINICYNELLTRAQSVISGLSSCSVTGAVLDSNELADLLYGAYNRDDKGLVSVKEAIESGFYRLYSTSEDAFMKKQELLQEQIENEARIKAIEAIQEAIKDGTYVPPEMKELDLQEQISKTASEMIKNERIPQEIKDTAKKILVEDYKKTKRSIVEKMQQNTQEMKNNLEEKSTQERIDAEKIPENTAENQKDEIVEEKKIKLKENKIENTVDTGDLVIENDTSKKDDEDDGEESVNPRKQFEQNIDLNINDDRLGSSSNDNSSSDDDIIR